MALIERARFPRHRCGETLHPGVEGVLSELGVQAQVEAASFLHHEGIYVRWPGGGRFQAYGADPGGCWRGVQACRAEFDEILLDRAREAGTTVVQPCRALRPLQDADGSVAGVRTTAGNFTARWTLDAAGAGHWLARCLGLSLERRSPRLIARYGYVEGSLPALDRGPDLRLRGSGWTWAAQVAPGLTAWTCLDLDGNHESIGPPVQLATLRPRHPARGADVSWRRLRKPGGPGYLALGDAAAVLDPASSHGVLRALISGITAAAVIRAAPSPVPRLEQFAHFTRTWFEHDDRHLRALYGELPAPPSWLAHTGHTRAAV